MHVDGSYWVLAAVQLVAVTGTWMTRSPTSCWNQWTCFAALAVLGISVVVALALFPATWALSAMVFGLGVLLATWGVAQGEALSQAAGRA